MANRAWKNWGIRRKFIIGRTLAAPFIGWLLLALPQGVLAQDSSPDEYQIKLAFLYNFTKFVEWPEQALPSQQTHLVI